MVVVRGCPCSTRPDGVGTPGASRISRFPRVKLLGMLRVCDTARASEGIAIAPSVVLPSPRHNEVGPWNEISVLNGWPAHAAVNASPTTLRAACAGFLVEPVDASLAVIVVRYSFRCQGLSPRVSRRLLPAHCVILCGFTRSRFQTPDIAVTYSAKRTGRPRLDAKSEALIVQMATDNPTWDEDSIRDRLAELGITVTVSCENPRLRRPMDSLPFLTRLIAATILA